MTADNRSVVLHLGGDALELRFDLLLDQFSDKLIQVQSGFDRENMLNSAFGSVPDLSHPSSLQFTATGSVAEVIKELVVQSVAFLYLVKMFPVEFLVKLASLCMDTILFNEFVVDFLLFDLIIYR